MKPVKTISPPEWTRAPETQAVMNALDDGTGMQALFVGGCVRNELLGVPVGDIDIATVHPPEDVIKKLEAAGLKAVPTGIEHGTVTAVADGAPFEITTLRRDVETDGRRAVVAYTQDWAEDAQRRDFTMNTLLADVEGHIYDPAGQGLRDLESRRVTFVGDPAQRIAEDTLRILRFFRFHAYYGEGAPDEDALSACRAAADRISALSKERITQEMLKILAVKNPVSTLSLMFENNVIIDFPDVDYQANVLERLSVLQERFADQQAQMVPARLFLLAGMKAGFFEEHLVLSGAQKKALQALEKGYEEMRRRLSSSCYPLSSCHPPSSSHPRSSCHPREGGDPRPQIHMDPGLRRDAEKGRAAEKERDAEKDRGAFVKKGWGAESGQDEQESELKHLEKTTKILIYKYKAEVAVQAVLLYYAAAAMDADEALDAALTLTKTWTPPVFPVTGKDLIKQGCKPGPELGERLATLEKEWIEEIFDQ